MEYLYPTAVLFLVKYLEGEKQDLTDSNYQSEFFQAEWKRMDIGWWVGV